MLEAEGAGRCPRLEQFVEYWLGREAQRVATTRCAAPTVSRTARTRTRDRRAAAHRAGADERRRGRHRRQRGARSPPRSPSPTRPAPSSSCFPELALTGYPPEDLLLKEHFLADTREALKRLAAEHDGDRRASSATPSAPRTSTTRPRSSPTGRSGPATASSTCPTTASSTSCATSSPARRGATIAIDGITVGLTICEDIWQPGPPLSDEALSGARVIVNLSASPYVAGKGRRREQMLQQRARDELVGGRVLRARRQPGRARLRRRGESP